MRLIKEAWEDVKPREDIIGKDEKPLGEDYENSPYYNLTYKVADGIFSALVVKAGSEEEAKKIFDEKKPDYADAVIGNRKISTEEAEGLLKRGMSLLEDYPYNQPKKIDFIHGYEIFEIKDSTSSTGKVYVARDPKSKMVSDEAFLAKSELVDYLYGDPTFESTFEDWKDEYTESLKEDFKSKEDALAYLKKKSEEDPEAAALIQAFLQLMREPKEESLESDLERVKHAVDQFKSQVTVDRSSEKDVKEFLLNKGIGFIIDDHITTGGKPGDRFTFKLKYNESLKEDAGAYAEAQKLLKRIATIAEKYDCEIWDFEDINHFKVQGSFKDISRFEKEFKETFKDQLNEDTQIDKIEIEVEAPEEQKSEEEEIADTPNPPEAGMDVYVANTLGDLIVGEWDTIKDYNNFMNELITNKASVDILNVIKDIVAEEHEHIGQLQQALKTVAPNAINLAAGEEEGSKQIAAPVDVGDLSVDGDKPTEEELADDTLLSPEEAEEKENG